MDVQQYLEEARQAVEKDLRAYFAATPVSKRLSEAMEYSLFAGGKRIRPALSMAACEALGTNRANAVPIGSALEMIHTYSLIHDDLPAMDNDDLRRGRPTNHKVYGDGVAILAGDGLLTEAFRRLADPKWPIPADRKIEIVRVIADGAGANGMVGGQDLDLFYEGKEIGEEVLKQIHVNKTGKLLWASSMAGAISAGANADDRERMDRYGRAIGLAFQIADDLLDVTSSTAELGKATQKDLGMKKATYPSILGMDESKRRAAILLKDAVDAVSSYGDRAGPLTDLARFIVERRS